MKQPSRPSWSFRGIFTARNSIQEHVYYIIADGRGIDFWKQPWHPEGIIQHQTSITTNIPSNCTVNDLRSDGGWDSIIDLPHLAELKKILHKALFDPDGEDTVVWKPCPNGKFSIKSAWEAIRAINFRLASRDRLLRQGIRVPHECPLCLQSSESIPHLFFKCAYSEWIWQAILRELNIKRRSVGLIEEEEWTRTQFKVKGQLSTAIKLLFQAAIYDIWHERNIRVHDNKRQHKQQILPLIISQVKSKLIARQRCDLPSAESISCTA
ncbi:uncharacterized protein LOC143866886 [Tasmannia lanceolata]|uniref:uncharacterized protein LOC143866886 n=1 Tax=Tasmannia lanceolata TaxID=3420 RepID=UPI004063522B